MALEWWTPLADRLGLARELGPVLVGRWSEPHRRYHDLDHLVAVLTAVDRLAAHADDPDLVRLAAWYHDAVYQGRPDDEEMSARLAETELPLDAASTAEVARLVRLTRGHRTAPGDRNGEVLCDADLTILASDNYEAYATAIRTEYAHVPDDAFRAGRAAVLRDLLALPTLYRTPHGRAAWEIPARANLTAELATLTAEPGPSDG
ncbi:HD domain-containing protein [Actinokineospora auranticolor]|uniref:Putative metal-dependent HD superfamily phosphohydrolase n=1 Tax=Actinokineospora auranticolor TaxID=155976 RepID=A0A2S6GYK1_9PSEU|nr:HD domain-containing protein [Actinokineospora auranticolor]PPK70332.1 putative metal-dependent HD superfamily phosphohydrolase [Actinokineospora auranticolor]